MSPALLLSFAQVGVNLLGASQSRRAARQGVRDTVIGGEMERFVLTQRGRLDAENRQRYLASVLGAQSAALASAGVGGGRTAQLLAAQAQAGGHRAQAAADQDLRLGLWASERQQGARLRGLRQGARQGELDLFASLLGNAGDIQQGWQARQAGG